MSEIQGRSAPALMGDLLTHVTELIRKEIQLLRAELNEKSTQVVVALGTIVAAVVIVLTALNVLATALVAALTNAGIPAAWAAILVGGLLAIIGFLMAGRGINSLKASNLAPQRTARAAERDATMVKEKI
jgi:cobalamin biosynthesis protein CobD/CbiB